MQASSSQSRPPTPNASLFFSESPTNPYLRCVDIERISSMCHAKVGVAGIAAKCASNLLHTSIHASCVG